MGISFSKFTITAVEKVHNLEKILKQYIYTLPKISKLNVTGKDEGERYLQILKLFLSKNDTNSI